MEYPTILLIAFFGGICYRIRGGWIPTESTFYARLAWAVPNGALSFIGMYIHDFVLWQCLLIGFSSGVLAFIGMLIPHSNSQDFTEGQKLQDTLGMSLVGFERNLLLAAPFFWHIPQMFLLVPFSILHGLFYLACNKYLFAARITWVRIPKSHPLPIPPARDELDSKYSVAFQGYTDFAEYLVGFYTFGVIAAILLLS